MSMSPSTRQHTDRVIHDGDIEKHQYFSAAKQQSCLLQMKLESILHHFTHDVSRVAERFNPHMMVAVSGLPTRLIVTRHQIIPVWYGGTTMAM